MVDGWVALQNRSIARRETLMGLPLPYAALLITSSLLLAVSMHLIGAADAEIHIEAVALAVGRPEPALLLLRVGQSREDLLGRFRIGALQDEGVVLSGHGHSPR